MNLLYLSPQFPGNFINFVTRLKLEGINVLGVASDPYECLPEPVRWALTEYYRVDNMNDYAQVLQAGRYFQEKFGAIDRIESHTEFWLTFEGALREDLNVWGKKRAETAMIRHKSLMKSAFRGAGITTARGELIRNIEDARRFIAMTGYPVIVKPDNGMGAASTWRINSEGELLAAFRQHDLNGYFIEEFVTGLIQTFDGLTDRNGDVVYMNSLVYSENIMEVVNSDNHTWYCTARDIPQSLVDAGMRTVKAFDVREKFFHLEFLPGTGDGRLVGLEVNIRPPGGFTVDLWNFADDIDLYAEWARMVSGKPFGSKWSRKYHVAHVSRKDNIAYAHSHEEAMSRFSSQIVHHERMSPLFRNALGDDAYLVRASSLAELKPVVDFLHSKAS